MGRSRVAPRVPAPPAAPSASPNAAQDEAKRQAALAGAALVEDGMVLGLGTGSTANLLLSALAERIKAEGLQVRGVPTSLATMELAKHLGIPLTTLEDDLALDLTIDGADEVDPRFRLIKGLGGALLREKVVAHASARVAILVDRSKMVDKLGTKAPLPVEVARFAWRPVQAHLRGMGCEPELRRAKGTGEPFVSDNGNLILDARFPRGIDAPEDLERTINNLPGVMENGLFLGLATEVVVGSPEGAEVLRRTPARAG
jgi:ribose 5-phosphate isomerase A